MWKGGPQILESTGGLRRTGYLLMRPSKPAARAPFKSVDDIEITDSCAGCMLHALLQAEA